MGPHWAIRGFEGAKGVKLNKNDIILRKSWGSILFRGVKIDLSGANFELSKYKILQRLASKNKKKINHSLKLNVIWDVDISKNIEHHRHSCVYTTQLIFHIFRPIC